MLASMPCHAVLPQLINWSGGAGTTVQKFLTRPNIKTVKRRITRLTWSIIRLVASLLVTTKTSLKCASILKIGRGKQATTPLPKYAWTLRLGRSRRRRISVVTNKSRGDTRRGRKRRSVTTATHRIRFISTWVNTTTLLRAARGSWRNTNNVLSHCCMILLICVFKVVFDFEFMFYYIARVRVGCLKGVYSTIV